MTTITEDPRIHRILVELEYRHAWEAINGLIVRRSVLSDLLFHALMVKDEHAAAEYRRTIANVDEAERRIREAADIRKEEERVEVRLP